MAVFEFENVFGDDYLHFHEPDLTPERNAREAEAIWRMLSLQFGQRVLDVGCGHGRIANELARRGAQVTGLDADPSFLGRARADASAAGVQVEYLEGDMRALPWRFDAALIWYTTFGYFDEADNERVLMEVAQALKPHGRVLIEQIDRAALLREGLPRNFVTERGDDLMIDRVSYDLRNERSRTERITVRTGHVRRAIFSVRLYGLAELAKLLHAVGFQNVEGFGRDGEPLALCGRRLIVVAEKAGRDAQGSDIGPRARPRRPKALP